MNSIIEPIESEQGPTSSEIEYVLSRVVERIASQRLPLATYRLQFNRECRFRDVELAASYFHALGITDLYSSPFLQAQPGSGHGYDIVNHSRINDEIGSIEELRSLSHTLRAYSIGMIADVVPNHMNNTPQLNSWWNDVLENGPSSPYASYFDIDWMPLKPDLSQKVNLPVLGEQFGRVLEDGQLVLEYGRGAFYLNYFDRRFPIAPRTYSLILSHRIDEITRQMGDQHPDLLELLSILTALKNLPPQNSTDTDQLAERRREKEVIKRRLHELVERSQEIARFVADNIHQLNGQPGNPSSFDLLDQLLQNQAYRLSYWRVASDEINYRRFFDINDLAAICTELPQVFTETHAVIFDLLDDETLTGVRIDHPDGLYDPRGYLYQLQRCRFLQLCRHEWENSTRNPENWPHVESQLDNLWRSATDVPGSPLARVMYVAVEKILAHDESLPEDWPVHGTVGYEFLNALNGIFVSPKAERTLSKYYSRFTGASLDFNELAYQCKRLTVRMSMSSELSVLGHRLDRISERNRWTRDFTLNSLTRALQEVVSCFSVYRTYIEPDRLLSRDAQYISAAASMAKRRNPAMSASIFDFVRDVLLLKYSDNADDEERKATQRLCGKFQQLTGPIMAKAVEDTAFYRFNRLVSLNEVGGEPARFGTTVTEFHQLNQSRLPRMSHALSATSTHDTKRGEDVRARINVLSEIPREWWERVRLWHRWNRKRKCEIDGMEAPSRNAEYLLYQTLVGIWPGKIPEGSERTRFVDRVIRYMLKVVREAKVNTSWISPNDAYELALSRFISAIFDAHSLRFVRDLNRFANDVADHGRWNSLAQLALKIASPGVPDFYQGSELWCLTLVDPDNRGPIDLEANSRTLHDLSQEMSCTFNIPVLQDVVETWLDDTTSIGVTEFLGRLLHSRSDGRVKLFVTQIGLRARRKYADLFSEGDYLPLQTVGRFGEHIVAFARRTNREVAIVVAPRWTVSITGLGESVPIGNVWADTRIIVPREIRADLVDQFSRRSFLATREVDDHGLAVADVLRDFPIAMMIGSR